MIREAKEKAEAEKKAAEEAAQAAAQPPADLGSICRLQSVCV